MSGAMGQVGSSFDGTLRQALAIQLEPSYPVQSGLVKGEEIFFRNIAKLMIALAAVGYSRRGSRSLAPEFEMPVEMPTS
jgi:hypothetical protein